MSKGIIDISQLQTPPQKHELSTARFFADLGKDVIFIHAHIGKKYELALKEH